MCSMMKWIINHSLEHLERESFSRKPEEPRDRREALNFNQFYQSLRRAMELWCSLLCAFETSMVESIYLGYNWLKVCRINWEVLFAWLSAGNGLIWSNIVSEA